MQYRKKPVVIEAFQLNARGLVGEDWFWDAVTRNDKTEIADTLKSHMLSDRGQQVAEKAGADFVKTSTGFVAPCHIYEIVNDINIFQKYAPKIKIEIFGGVDSYKIANQVLTAGADKISSNNGYEIVKTYKDLRENTQVKPKPITLTKK